MVERDRQVGCCVLHTVPVMVPASETPGPVAVAGPVTHSRVG